MRPSIRPLIVGAGPVGLAAALFLKRKGHSVRLIDAADSATADSKALAVNPRTLELLESTGITAKMLRLGTRIRGAQLWQDDKVIGQAILNDLPSKYPFMLALSQATTERLLADEFEKLGGQIERGTAIVACRKKPSSVEAILKIKNHAGTETVEAPWLLAADGSHSTIRESLKMKFEGTSFSEPWILYDVPLRTEMDPEFAQLRFLKGGGFLFMMRVIGEDGNSAPSPYPLWRVMGNIPNPLDFLLSTDEVMGPPAWKSEFHISHRIVDHMSSGHVHFAGDAAHIHSPIGARGMNLGIEDAWALSELADIGELDRYDQLRRPIDLAVVKHIDTMSRFARGESALLRAARGLLLPFAIKLVPFSMKMKRTVSGLDHELPIIRQPIARTTTALHSHP